MTHIFGNGNLCRCSTRIIISTIILHILTLAIISVAIVWSNVIISTIVTVIIASWTKIIIHPGAIARTTTAHVICEIITSRTIVIIVVTKVPTSLRWWAAEIFARTTTVERPIRSHVRTRSKISTAWRRWWTVAVAVSEASHSFVVSSRSSAGRSSSSSGGWSISTPVTLIAHRTRSSIATIFFTIEIVIIMRIVVLFWSLDGCLK